MKPVRRFVKYRTEFTHLPRLGFGRMVFKAVCDQPPSSITIIRVSCWGWAYAVHYIHGDPFFYPEEHDINHDSTHSKLSEYQPSGKFHPTNARLYSPHHGPHGR